MTPKIPKKDLSKIYRSNGTSREGHNLGSLLKELETSINPIELREDICNIGQLYINGIIGGFWSDLKYKITLRENSWEEQKKVLDAINTAGIYSIGQFYYGQGIDTEKARELILPYASEIVKYGSSNGAKFRHIWDEINDVQKLGIYLQNNPKAIDPIDSVVAVATGGLEPAYLIASLYGIKDIGIARYSIVSEKDKYVKVPGDAPVAYLAKYCNGKNVAVVEDVICTGESIGAVIGKVLNSSPKRVVGIAVEDESNTQTATTKVMRKFEGRHREEISHIPPIFEIIGDV